jgi:DnaJ-domain-containing protein 1
MNDWFILIITYCFAYGGGLLISKLWGWLQVVVIVLIAKTLYGYDFMDMNFSFFLVVVVPLLILMYPAISKKFGHKFNLSVNPFRWVVDKVNELRYRRRREREMEQERIVRMQAEERERQREYEREKARQEKAEREEREARERERNRERERDKAKEKEKEKTKADTNKDPYEVLGVLRSASFEEVRRAYRELASKYHPDKVSHLAKEFQDMANEKLKEINGAWEKIRREKGKI